jgi:arylsulfatase A-like enzyme
MLYNRIGLFLLLIVCFGILSAWGGKPEDRPPNVIFIVIDTLRRDHVGCYNYERPTTPELDKIAGEGVRCNQAIAASSWTLPSVMSIFTSLPPSLHKLVDPACRLPSAFTTLAAELKKAGYATAAITSNPLTSSKFGFSRGFDFYDDITVIHQVGDLFLGAEDFRHVRPKSAPPTSDRINQVALSWLKKHNRDKPFFLFLLYLDPHDDYTPPPPYDGQFTDSDYEGKYSGMGTRNLVVPNLSPEDKRQIIGLYDGEIRFTDHYIGRIMEHLKVSGLCDNAITVVVADHGEEFWDHGGMFHGHTLYEELVRVPLIIRYPGRIPAGLVVKEQVSHLDIMPTILDMAGLPIPAQCQGQSLRPSLEGRSKLPSGRPAYMETFCAGKNLRGVRTPSQKIVEQLHDNRTLMFDLVGDPFEQHNLFGTERAREFVELGAEFGLWKQAVAAQTNAPVEQAELPPPLLRKLQSMGYAH